MRVRVAFVPTDRRWEDTDKEGEMRVREEEWPWYRMTGYGEDRKNKQLFQRKHPKQYKDKKREVFEDEPFQLIFYDKKNTQGKQLCGNIKLSYICWY